MIPDRSAITPPLAANRYGIEIRTICVRNEIGFMRLPAFAPCGELHALQAPTSQPRESLLPAALQPSASERTRELQVRPGIASQRTAQRAQLRKDDFVQRVRR